MNNFDECSIEERTMTAGLCQKIHLYKNMMSSILRSRKTQISGCFLDILFNLIFALNTEREDLVELELGDNYPTQ